MLWASEEQHQQVLQTKSKRKGKVEIPSASVQPLGSSNRPNAKKGKSAGHKARARSSSAVPGSKPKAHKGQPVRWLSLSLDLSFTGMKRRVKLLELLDWICMPATVA